MRGLCCAGGTISATVVSHRCYHILCYNIDKMKRIDTSWKEGTNEPGLAISILLLPLTIPHELSHYLAGRLLGVKISMGLYRVRYNVRGVATWKQIVISLAPTILGASIGILALLYLLSGPISKPRAYVALIGFTYSALMITSCYQDWISFRSYVRDLSNSDSS